MPQRWPETLGKLNRIPALEEANPMREGVHGSGTARQGDREDREDGRGAKESAYKHHERGDDLPHLPNEEGGTAGEHPRARK